MFTSAEEIVAEHKVTEREILIARVSADLAVRQLTDHFYKEVGRTFVSRWLIVIGGMVVAFAVGKGWLPIPGK